VSGVITLPHLRGLVGLRVSHLGQICRIIEVLDEPPSLVLQPDQPPSLMPDHLGRSFEYSEVSIILPVLTEDQTGLNNALLELDILD